MAVAALLLGSCAKTGMQSPLPEREGVTVPLALSIGRAAQTPETKMSAEITQQSGAEHFRGIECLYVLPFKAEGAVVTATDERWAQNLWLPQLGLPAQTFGPSAQGGEFEGLVSNSNAHLYDQVYLKLLTNSVLVYGRALDEEVTGDDVVYKHRNGVLTPTDLVGVKTAGDISFSLEPIVTDDIWNKSYNSWKSGLITYLGSITTASVRRNNKSPYYYFYNPATYNHHPQLEAAFNEFIGEGRMFSISDKVLSQKLTRLYRAIFDYTNSNNSLDYNEDGRYFYVAALANAICEKIIGTKSTPNKYVTYTGSGKSINITIKEPAPSSFGLPEGVLPIQYRESSHAFGVLESFSGMATIKERDFSYPPSLWYYVNSPLISTEDEEVTEAYIATDDKSEPVTWGSLTERYDHQAVTGSSAAVAIQKPVQYGVGLMLLSLQKVTTAASNFKDARGNKVGVDHTNFPLTGIILGDQRPVGFDFTPVIDPEDRNIRYIYDSDVNDSNGKPLAYISSKNNVSSPVSMLVLQTPESSTEKPSPVHFALEFKNATKSSFFAADGCEIYPGSHFYLLGLLKRESASYTGTETLNSVFMQDFVTRVNAYFNTLANAYGILPSLDDPQLLLGVTADFYWDLSTPVDVPIQ